APDRDHHLDRADLSPPPPAGQSGPIDLHRVRDHHEPDRQPGGLNPAVTCSRISPPPPLCGSGATRQTATSPKRTAKSGSRSTKYQPPRQRTRSTGRSTTEWRSSNPTASLVV